MIAALLLSTVVFAESRCALVERSTFRDITPPAILVLGERHGTQPDLLRVHRVIRQLAQRAPVTLALEALHHSQQRTLDRFADGDLNTAQLMEAIPLSSDWSFSLSPYESLISGALKGYDVLAVRPDLSAPRKNQPIPVPPELDHHIQDNGLKVPIDSKWSTSLNRSIAWYEHRLAKTAIQNWNQRGFLVIIVDRSHVEGGRGVAWQARQLSQVPVTDVTMTWSELPCYEGSVVWRRAPSDWLQTWLSQENSPS